MLKLYTKKGCPYCIKVTDFARKHSILLQKKDISEPQNLRQLLDKGGMRQVPFLVDEEAGISMYESQDIVRYLKEKYEK